MKWNITISFMPLHMLFPLPNILWLLCPHGEHLLTLQEQVESPIPWSVPCFSRAETFPDSSLPWCTLCMLLLWHYHFDLVEEEFPKSEDETSGLFLQLRRQRTGLFLQLRRQRTETHTVRAKQRASNSHLSSQKGGGLSLPPFQAGTCWY